MNAGEKRNLNLILAGAATFSLIGGLVYVQRNKIGELVENNLEFELLKIGFTPGFPVIILPVDFRVTNDNVVGAQNISFSGKLYYEGTKIGEILPSQPFNLDGSASADAKAEVYVNLQLEKLKDTLISIISTKSFTDQVEVRGTISSSFGDFPISRKISIT